MMPISYYSFSSISLAYYASCIRIKFSLFNSSKCFGQTLDEIWLSYWNQKSWGSITIGLFPNPSLPPLSYFAMNSTSAGPDSNNCKDGWTPSQILDMLEARLNTPGILGGAGYIASRDVTNTEAETAVQALWYGLRVLTYPPHLLICARDVRKLLKPTYGLMGSRN